jgi:catechol 2,3-dioxygenase-like lactoylglutathione lyase family enzyme
MQLSHLGLPVEDAERSMRFYATYFAFDPATARSYPDGTVIVRNADQFDLALHQTESPNAQGGFLHFGFGLPDADQVRALRARMDADGVPLVESDEEPTLVSFKCLDPDGWRIEVFWESVS